MGEPRRCARAPRFCLRLVPGCLGRPGRAGGRRWYAAPAAPLLVWALAALLSAAAGAQTAAPAAEFVFTAAGDFGASGDASATLQAIGAAGAAGSSFHLALGDLSYGNLAPEAAWCDFVKARVGPDFPFELVSGNHDEDGSGQGHITAFAACLPHRLGPLTGAYGTEYYFDHNGLARVIMIAPNLTLDGQGYDYTSGSAHYNWLAGAIDGARAAGLPWVVVGMHEDCVTMGTKGCEIGADLLNLLVGKKVDLVLQAHDHTYQRSKQLAHGAGCPAVPAGAYNVACVADDGADGAYARGAGTIFLVVGTGGAGLYDVSTADPEAGYFAAWMGANSNSRKGFLRVTVSATQLAAEFVGTNATSGFTDRFAIGGAAPAATATPSATTPATLIARGAVWRYLDNGTDQGTAWRAPSFDDGTWASGPAELGYGDGDEATVVGYGPDPANKHVTTYFRHAFAVADPAAYASLAVRVRRDDGAVVYLNGQEVFRTNMPAGTITSTTLAAAVVVGADEAAFFEASVPPGLLVAGTNVVAVEVHQAAPASSDISFDLELGGTARTGSANPSTPTPAAPAGAAGAATATPSPTPTAAPAPAPTSTLAATATAAAATATSTRTPTSASTPTATRSPTAAALTLTFRPAADAHVEASRPDQNLGAAAGLEVDGSP